MLNSEPAHVANATSPLITETVIEYTRDRFPHCRKVFQRQAVRQISREFPANGTRRDAEILLDNFHVELCRDFIFTEQTTRHISRLAERRFPFGGVELDAENYVLDKLTENRFGRLRKYNGPASKQAYLRTVVSNLLESFSRGRYGYLQTPGWIKAMGTSWTRIFQLLFVEQTSVEMIIRIMTERKDAPGHTPEKIRKIITDIRKGVRAYKELKPGESHDRPVSYNDDWVGAEPDDPTAHSAEHLVSDILNFVANIPMTDSGSQLTRDLRDLNLSDDDLLILRLVYLNNEKATVVAGKLGIEKNNIYRRISKLLDRIFSVLDTHGIGLDEKGLLVLRDD